MTYVKKRPIKIYIALILVIALSIGGIAGAYVVLTAPKPVDIGVKVGDTFTYGLVGTYNPMAEGATPTAGFSQYNNTEYYMVTITAINGTNVSMNTNWRFKNGTEVTSTQTIDVGNGEKTDEYGFWAIYPANLNIKDNLRPRGYDGTYVNNTDTYTYSTGLVRDRCYWFINNQFYDVRDETRSTLMYDYRNIFFDRQTGMLLSFTNHQFYNNPEKEEVIIWTLKSSSVWQV